MDNGGSEYGASMIQWLFSPANMLFGGALAIFLLLAVLEIVSLVLGAAVSQSVDAALDLDADVPAGVETGGGGHSLSAGVLDWMNVGSVPLVFLLMLLLGAFGFSGLAIQTFTGGRLPPALVAVPSLVAGLAAMKWIGSFVARFVVREFSSAVTEDSLLGHSATIVLGATHRGKPSQAKLADEHGQTHYVLVEPLKEGDSFEAGCTVMLVKRDGPKYYVIEESVEALLNLGPQDLPAEHRQQV
jgi:hypothetical protein